MGRTDKNKQSNLDKFAMRDPPRSSKADPPPRAEAPEPAADSSIMSTILQELRETHSSLGAKIDGLVSRMDLMQNRITDIGTRTTEAENRIGGVEDEVHRMDSTITTLDSRVKQLSEKVDDLEGRSRRSNVRILGLPEGTERGRMEIYIEELLTHIFNRSSFSAHFVVERAHRTLGPKPVPGANPRPILLKLLNYRDRDAILRMAREKEEITHEGSKLMFFPDFSPAVQRARKSFDNVRKALRIKNIPYAMTFPARLKIMVDHKAEFFTDPEKALEYAEGLRSRFARSPRDRGSPD